MSQSHAETADGFRITGWHVLAAFCAVFGVTIAVNVYFVIMALKTFSGETEHAYIKGLKFNETIAAQQAQARTGWGMRLDLRRPVSGPPVLEATLTDRAGAPIKGARMSGQLGRTTTAAEDVAFVFAESAPGVYRADLDTLKPGKWRFSAEAKLGGYPDFKTETVLSLR
jgi:nitrogen fixation protein FixH